MREVEKVKRTQHGVIGDPYSIGPARRLSEARALMARSRVGTLVVVDDQRRLLGTADRARSAVRRRRSARRVADRMTPLDRLVVHRGAALAGRAPSASWSSGRSRSCRSSTRDGVLNGLVTAKDLVRQRRRPFATRDAQGRLMVGAAIGATGDYLERAAELIEAESTSSSSTSRTATRS